ncbi:MAG: hybrid sensor histidine kinase/response regulator [Caldilineaceae bacterium]|nr:hybrid sensor histidine kinase/response regulator [Caldilineaceae bacterium]
MNNTQYAVTNGRQPAVVQEATTNRRTPLQHLGCTQNPTIIQQVPRMDEKAWGTILVVDETKESALALADLLTEHHFRVELAFDGPQALTLAPQRAPDLILLAVGMSLMDGFAVCQSLKQDRRVQDIPIIFISAAHEVFDKVHAFQVGAVDFLTKPFQPEEVLACVETHLTVRRLHERLQVKHHLLTEALKQLQTTQQQLVESEKMASLGNLVAEIAHEINTPIGIGVTAASTLEDETTALKAIYQRGGFTRAGFEAYLETATHSSQLILNNLQRASVLIQNLKQISTDQIYLERRRFTLHQYIHEILSSLEPTLKHTHHTVTTDGSEEVTLESYPGALSQIVTNLVMNSLKHAYPTGEAGVLHFSWQMQPGQLVFCYSDDGCGIPEADRSHVFEPFFTTARHNGGTGLGLHIVYSLVTQKLGGQIRCESRQNQGTTFVLELPTRAPLSTADSPMYTIDDKHAAVESNLWQAA